MEEVNKCFIVSIKGYVVECYFFITKEYRIINNIHFFTDKELFIGKNIIFTSSIKPGTLIVKCEESKKIKIVQLWNYYIKGKF